MSISTVGSHTVSSCPYCDTLLTVPATGAEGMHALMAVLHEHFKDSPECCQTHQRTVRHVFGTLAANPLSAAFLEELLPHERPHDDDLLDVAKITKNGDPEVYYLEASDLSALPTTLGTNSRYSIEWVRMTVKEYETLTHQQPAFCHAHAQAVHQGDEH